ncbi:MAG: hypothetical protein H7831_01095 [Magnetococcus sp. WYHC-3]
MKRKFREIQDRIDLMGRKDRFYLLVIVLLGFGGAPVYLGVDYVEQELTRIDNETRSAKGQVTVEKVRQQEALARAGVDPNEANRRYREELQDKIKTIDGELDNAKRDLVSPWQMLQVVRQVLQDSPGVDLLSLEVEKATPLWVGESGKDDKGTGKGKGKDKDRGRDKDKGKSTASGDNESSENRKLAGKKDATIYRHAIKVRIAGDFQGLMRYLGQLESAPWMLYWDEVEYQVMDYPAAVMSLTIFTLSFSTEWLSV